MAQTTQVTVDEPSVRPSVDIRQDLEGTFLFNFIFLFIAEYILDNKYYE